MGLISFDSFCMSAPSVWHHTVVKDRINLTEHNKAVWIITQTLSNFYGNVSLIIAMRDVLFILITTEEQFL